MSTAFFGVSIKAGSSGVAALRASKVRDFVLYLREEAKKEQETYSKEETRRNLWHQQVHWVDVPDKVKSTIVQYSSMMFNDGSMFFWVYESEVVN